MSWINLPVIQDIVRVYAGLYPEKLEEMVDPRAYLQGKMEGMGTVLVLLERAPDVEVLSSELLMTIVEEVTVTLLAAVEAARDNQSKGSPA